MRNLFNKRIPTILGITLILLSIPLTTLLLKNQTLLKSKALNSQQPQDVKITNISAQSFTITYRTDVPATGSINYGHDKNLGESELEDVDKRTGSFSPKKIHSISAKELTPATKYYLVIISGSDTFLNNGVPFEITTGPNISFTSTKEQAIKGKIILPDGSTPLDAIVYLNAENSQLLSSIITKDGEYDFSLKELRTNDLSSYFNVQNNTVFTIFATDGSLKSTSSVSLNQTGSVPTITLSNDYNFAEDVSPAASNSAQPSGFPPIAPLGKNLILAITTPKDNQSFSSPKPQFRGTSLPNAKVEIIIHSDEQITTEITADNNGNWTYTPPNNLSPGAHTITIKTRDSLGILTTITKSFTVFAAETTQIPTPSVLPTLMPLPTQMPISLPSPTIIPSLSPSPIIAPITSKGGLPPTGSSSMLLMIGGVAAAISGLALFLLL